MKTKKQKVEIYSNIQYAKQNMNRNIDEGWFVHTCIPIHENDDMYSCILAVYERDLETWN